MSFLKLLESGYIDEKPRHITDPNRSVFDVIASSDFQHLSTKEIQDRLRAKNIVVTGCENPTMMFDKPGFRTLTSWNRLISIQGTNLMLNKITMLTSCE